MVLNHKSLIQSHMRVVFEARNVESEDLCFLLIRDMKGTCKRFNAQYAAEQVVV